MLHLFFAASKNSCDLGEFDFDSGKISKEALSRMNDRLRSGCQGNMSTIEADSFDFLTDEYDFKAFSIQSYQALKTVSHCLTIPH